VFRGETFIENVERLADGSSHLLLRIDEDNDLVDAKNPNKTKGKYKYRFKRVNANLQELPAAAPVDTTAAQSEPPPLTPTYKAKKASTTPTGSSRASNRNVPDENDQEEIVDGKNSKTAKSASSRKKSTASPDNEEDSDKNSAKTGAKSKSKRQPSGGADDADQNDEPGRSSTAVSRANKTKPVVGGDDETTADAGSSVFEDPQRPGRKSSKSKPSGQQEPESEQRIDERPKKKAAGGGGPGSRNQMEIVESDQDATSQDGVDDVDDDDDEINVTNESYVTRVVKDKEKNINQEKTVIIDEKFETVPDDIDDATDGHQEVIDNDEIGLVEKEENTKSFIDNETRVTTRETGKNKPSKTEVVTKREHIEPQSHTAVKYMLGDEKFIEKFKPEETFEYEYEQVIEQPRRGSKAESEEAEPEPDEASTIKVENTQRRTTQHETREKFEKVEKPTAETKKLTTTDLTTLITEEEVDKITETIENSKDSEAFSYEQLKERLKKKGLSGQVIDEMSLNDMAEEVDPGEVAMRPEDNMQTVSVSRTAGVDFTANGEPKRTVNQSSENIEQYYNLRPPAPEPIPSLKSVRKQQLRDKSTGDEERQEAVVARGGKKQRNQQQRSGDEYTTDEQVLSDTASGAARRPPRKQQSYYDDTDEAGGGGGGGGGGTGQSDLDSDAGARAAKKRLQQQQQRRVLDSNNRDGMNRQADSPALGSDATDGEGKIKQFR
jgi:hypothetical protein